MMLSNIPLTSLTCCLKPVYACRLVVAHSGVLNHLVNSRVILLKDTKWHNLPSKRLKNKVKYGDFAQTTPDSSHPPQMILGFTIRLQVAVIAHILAYNFVRSY